MNEMSLHCIRHYGIKVNCTYSVIKDSIIVQKKYILELLHTPGSHHDPIQFLEKKKMNGKTGTLL